MATSLKAPPSYRLESVVDDITVVTAIHEDANERRREWLKEAKGSLPVGIKFTVVENQGEVGESYNMGVAAADTEWVFIMGADDMVAPDCLEFLLSLGDGMDVVYPTQILIDEDGTEKVNENRAAPFCPHRLETENYVSGAALVRRSAWLEAGGYDEDLEALEDWDLWLRMAKGGARFLAVPEAQYLWRQHEGGRNSTELGAMGLFTMDEFRDQLVPEPTVTKAAWILQSGYVTSYLRALLPARYLPGSCWSWEHFPIVADRAKAKVEFPHVPDTVILQYPCDTYRLEVMWALQNEGKRVLVEVDDNYIDGNKSRYIDTGKSEKAVDGPHSYEAHRKIVDMADGVIVTTEQLRKRYLKLNDTVYVCPNQIDPTDWPELEKPDDGIFRVGWFAARGHYEDIPIVFDALRWAGEQKDIEVYVMGLELTDWRNKLHYTQLPWTNDLRTYFRLLMNLDVGLSPIHPTQWAICRSDIKVLEYGMAGVMPIVQDEIPYDDWRTGDFLWKVGHREDFLKSVKWAYRHQDESRALGSALRAHVLENRTIQNNVHFWEEAINAN